MQPKTGNDLRDSENQCQVHMLTSGRLAPGAEAKLSLVGWIHMAYLELPLRYYVSFLVRLTQEVPLANMQSYAIKTKRIWRMTV